MYLEGDLISNRSSRWFLSVSWMHFLEEIDRFSFLFETKTNFSKTIFDQSLVRYSQCYVVCLLFHIKVFLPSLDADISENNWGFWDDIWNIWKVKTVYFGFKQEWIFVVWPSALLPAKKQCSKLRRGAMIFQFWVGEA